MKDRIGLIQGDICVINVDAIICHANTELETEDPITRQIFQAGGEDIIEECDRLTGLQKGKAVVTTGGKLRTKHLIHAIINESKEESNEEELMATIREAFQVAKQNGYKTVALPLIGQNDEIPVKRAAELLLTEVKKHFDGHSCVEKIIFVVTEDYHYDALEEAIRQVQ